MWFSLLSSLSRWNRTDSRPQSARRRATTRLNLEPLDDRVVPATLSVSAAGALEGGMIAFTVSLSEPAAASVTVRYDTVDDSAVSKPKGQNSDRDYNAASGTLTFTPGETSKTVYVQSIDDAWFEGNETFSFKLSQAKGAGIAVGAAIGVIEDNDPDPSYSYYDPDVPGTYPTPDPEAGGPTY